MPDESNGKAVLAAILRRRRRKRALRALALLLAIAGGAYLWLRGGREPAPMPEPSPPAPVAREEPARPAPERPEPEPPPPARPPSPPPAPLPPLDASDAAVREEVSTLSDDPRLSVWLGVDNLVERFVLAVVNVQEGKSPRKPLAHLAPVAAYRARTRDEVVTPDPAGYARYDGIASVFAGLDAARVAALYRRFEPLFDEAHARLGSPGEPLRVALVRAAAEVLATPRVEGEPRLVFHVNRYRYADPKLESLSSVQKLLLRTGPENARRIQDKIREIARALGVQERELPAPSVYRVGGS